MTENVIPNHDELIDTKSLATRWGWSPGSIYTLRVKEKFPIPFMRIGNRVRFRMSDVVAYENSRTVKTQNQSAAIQN